MTDANGLTRQEVLQDLLENPPAAAIEAMAAERSGQMKRNGHGEWAYRDLWQAAIRAVLPTPPQDREATSK